jgi:hypothetical protein
MDSVQSERLIADGAEFQKHFAAAVDAGKSEAEKKKEKEEKELAV